MDRAVGAAVPFVRPRQTSCAKIWTVVTLWSPWPKPTPKCFASALPRSVPPPTIAVPDHSECFFLHGLSVRRFRAARAPRVLGVTIARSRRSGRTEASDTRGLRRPDIGKRQNPCAPPLASALVTKRPKIDLKPLQLNPRRGISRNTASVRLGDAPLPALPPPA